MSASSIAPDGALERLELSLRAEAGDPAMAIAVIEHGVSATLEAVRSGALPDGSPAPEGWFLGPRRDLVDRAAALLHTSSCTGGRWVVPGDVEWPDRLTDLDLRAPLNRRAGPPLGLWARGPRELSDTLERSVAVVGCRSATSYGESVAGQLGAGLAERDVASVSGAAFGIDSAAHRGSLALRGPTVAVLACGVDVAYPRAHTALLDRVGAEGLVVSELPPGSTPTRWRFLARNRLIAAMSVGTVVVEAAVRSGALNTAHWALGLGRVTMGVPGPVTSTASAGVHGLLRDGGALLVCDAEQVWEAVAPAGSGLLEPPRLPARAFDLLGGTHQQVLEALTIHGSHPVAAVAARARLPQSEVCDALAALVAAGVVHQDVHGVRLSGDGVRLVTGRPRAASPP
jgi:DNA processing protein